MRSHRGRREIHQSQDPRIKTKTGTDQLSFNQIVVAVGSRPARLPGFEIDHERILDSTSALDQREKPETLLCIGGGYIGLELGTFYAKIGTKVTVVEAGPGLLGGVDPQLTAVVQKNLVKRGVELKIGIA